MGLEDLRKKLENRVNSNYPMKEMHYIPESIHNTGLCRYGGPYLFDVLYDITKSQNVSVSYLMQRFHMSAEDAISWIKWLETSLFISSMQNDGKRRVMDEEGIDSVFKTSSFYLNIKYQMEKDACIHPFEHSLVDILNMYPHQDIFTVNHLMKACRVSENRAREIIALLDSLHIAASIGNGYYRFALMPDVWERMAKMFDVCFEANDYPRKKDGLKTYDIVGLDYYDDSTSLLKKSFQFFHSENADNVAAYYIAIFKAIVLEDVNGIDTLHALCLKKCGYEGEKIFNSVLDLAKSIGLLREYRPYTCVVSNMIVDDLDFYWSSMLNMM